MSQPDLHFVVLAGVFVVGAVGEARAAAHVLSHLLVIGHAARWGEG